MSVERIEEPKHLAIYFTAAEYQAVEQAAAKSGQSVEAALYSTLLVKLGAAMQEFVTENGLQNLVIEVRIEDLEDDTTQDDLDALDKILGGIRRADGSIDFAKLDAKTEIVDLDEWE